MFSGNCQYEVIVKSVVLAALTSTTDTLSAKK